MSLLPTNSRAFSGEPSERSERPERKRGRQVRCNAMLGSPPLIQPYVQRQELPCDRQKFFGVGEAGIPSPRLRLARDRNAADADGV